LFASLYFRSAQHCLYAGDILTYFSILIRPSHLARSLLHTQVELLTAQPNEFFK
jgi:hypothetical protein